MHINCKYCTLTRPTEKLFNVSVFGGIFYRSIFTITRWRHNHLLRLWDRQRLQSWTIHQTAILSVLSSCEPLHICGSGGSDSPGFSAKYTTYTVMDMTTSLDQQLVWLADDDINSSVAMETEALDKCLDFVMSCGLKIHRLPTWSSVSDETKVSRNWTPIWCFKKCY